VLKNKGFASNIMPSGEKEIVAQWHSSERINDDSKLSDIGVSSFDFAREKNMVLNLSYITKTYGKYFTDNF
tara:strand:- start:1926 stop:2138 length:213 start_codon:yes stop_codon:yes gene_type:complete